jgi:hypothetical protein
VDGEDKLTALVLEEVCVHVQRLDETHLGVGVLVEKALDRGSRRVSVMLLSSAHRPLPKTGSHKRVPTYGNARRHSPSRRNSLP